jgi:magnesium transporter
VQNILSYSEREIRRGGSKDDINQRIELVESYQGTVNSTRELYIANVSLQMNDTAKTLTIFLAVLLSLTFISSMYGMNDLDLNDI